MGNISFTIREKRRSQKYLDIKNVWKTMAEHKWENCIDLLAGSVLSGELMLDER